MSLGAAQALAKTLRRSSTVTSVDLSRNQIGDQGVAVIVAAVKKNRRKTRLQELRLAAAGLTTGGASELAYLLNNTSTLTSLDLESKSTRATVDSMHTLTTITVTWQ